MDVTEEGPTEKKEALEAKAREQEEKEAEDEEAAARKKLHDDIAAAWAKLETDPFDFSCWTSLVGLVEQKKDLEDIRKVLLGLLDKFPLCFGYWKRLSIHESRAGNKEQSLKILNQGLDATPHSLQLWQHTAGVMLEEGTAEARKFFQRAIEVVELDFKAGALLEQYAKFEEKDAKETGDYSILNKLLLRLMHIPLSKSQELYNMFQSFAKDRNVADLQVESDQKLFADEIQKREKARAAKLAAEREKKAKEEAAEREKKAKEEADKKAAEAAQAKAEESGDAETEKATDQQAGEGKAQEESAPKQSEEGSKENKEEGDEAQAMDTEETPPPIVLTDQEKVDIILRNRSSIHRDTIKQQRELARYEHRIKRHYFHVKPLKSEEVKAWSDYLNYMDRVASRSSSSLARAIKTFERALVSAALNAHFWLKYSSLLLKHDMVDRARESLVKATSHYCKNKPKVFLAHAALEERYGGNVGRARELLRKVTDTLTPNDVSAVLLLAQFERRHASGGDYSAVEAVFTKALDSCFSTVEVKKQKKEQSADGVDGADGGDAAEEKTETKRVLQRKPQFVKLSLHFANFLRYVARDANKALEVYREALKLDETNPSLYTSLIDAMVEHGADQKSTCAEFDRAISKVSHQDITSLLWSRYLDYVESYGSDLSLVNKVAARMPSLSRHVKKRKQHYQDYRGRQQRRRHRY